MSIEGQSQSFAQPRFSVIVPVRNDGVLLQRCLSSLLRQQHAPGFEVIVVDDGSEPAIDTSYCGRNPVTLERQIPLGVSAARNRGIQVSRGLDLVFMDVDCQADPRMLSTLALCMDQHPYDPAFQLELRGGDLTVVERLEDLHLKAIQSLTRTANGRIRYLNTSGFAMRRVYAREHAALFDPGAVRGEDSLVLADLLRSESAPRFAIGAVVEHRPPLSTLRYVLKHLLIGYHTGYARRALAKSSSLLSSERRWTMFRSIVSHSRDNPFGAKVVGLLLACYGFERLGRLCHRLFGLRRDRQRVLSVFVDPLRTSELIARILGAAEEQAPSKITYLTAWTLVQAYRDAEFSRLLSSFDLIYADGMGVVLTLLATRLRRCRKITASDFFMPLAEEMAQRRLRLGLVGASERVIEATVRRLRQEIPRLQIVYHHSGYIPTDRAKEVLRGLVESAPDLVVFGMGQPLQEKWTELVQRELRVPVYCVGGLFDLLSGDFPAPAKWIRRFGLEWSYRLARRPRLFWRRYLLGLPALLAFASFDFVAGWSRIREERTSPSKTDERCIGWRVGILSSGRSGNPLQSQPYGKSADGHGSEEHTCFDHHVPTNRSEN